MNQFKKAKQKALESGHQVENIKDLQTAGVKTTVDDKKIVEEPKQKTQNPMPTPVKVETPVIAETGSTHVENPVVTEATSTPVETPIAVKSVAPTSEEAPIMVNSIPVQVETPNTIESAPLHIETPVTTEPTPVRIETPVVTEPTPVRIETPVVTESTPLPVATPIAAVSEAIYEVPTSEPIIEVQQSTPTPVPVPVRIAPAPSVPEATYTAPVITPVQANTKSSTSKKNIPNIFAPKNEAKSMRKSLVLKPTSVKIAENYCAKNGGSFNELIQTLLDNFIDEYGL